MHEIFISYRRVDTGASASDLRDDLCDAFGEDSIFMDIRPNSIPWGADWVKALNSALANCDALIALVGPQWLRCERRESPGVRRLDAPDDWVRSEIATVLKRQGVLGQNVLVLPVLIAEAPPPPESELPEELRSLGFANLQANAIREGNWKSDVSELVDRLLTLPTLKQRHDLATAQTGIRQLQKLIETNSEVADAVVRSREVIESTDQEIGELRTFKLIHDALHTIEADCLKQMRVDVSAERLLTSSFDFAVPCADIRAACRAHRPADPLLEDLVERLDHISGMFEGAKRAESGIDRDSVLGELENLISWFPGRLDLLISQAGRRLQLGRLVELMATVTDILPKTAALEPELKPLLDTIDALKGIERRLNQLIREHGALQSLDMNLRDICVGMRGTDASVRGKPWAVASAWDQIKRQRARLKAPYSPELQQAGIAGLEEMELQTTASVASGNDRAAIGNFGQYFHMVGVVFQALDNRLKELCSDLDRKTEGLRNILLQLEKRHG